MTRVGRLVATLAIAAAWHGAAAQPPSGPVASDGRRSGTEFMSEQTRAMQRDDASNPGMLWVLDGQALWNREEGAQRRSCANCHGDATRSMRGVAARLPVSDAASGRVVDLAQRINECRVSRQGATPLDRESQPLLALEAYVAHQSRGLPVEPSRDGATRRAAERGRVLYERRMGQLDLSCAQCHDRLAGRRLGGSLIPQGHPTGYPIYRLEWQALGSLQRRLRNCMTGVRAEPFPFGAQELGELEVYLRDRAAGMPIETPAVRP